MLPQFVGHGWHCHDYKVPCLDQFSQLHAKHFQTIDHVYEVSYQTQKLMIASMVVKSSYYVKKERSKMKFLVVMYSATTKITTTYHFAMKNLQINCHYRKDVV